MGNRPRSSLLLSAALVALLPADSGAEPSGAAAPRDAAGVGAAGAGGEDRADAVRPDSAGGSRSVEVVDVRFPEAAARALSEHGAWLPVYIELRTTSRDARLANIEGAVIEDRARAFSIQEPIEVAPGASRRAWVYLQARPSRSSEQSAAVDVRSPSGGTLRTGDRWTLGSLMAGEGSHRVLVVGEDASSGVPWPRGTTPFSQRSQNPPVESVDYLPSRALPDSVLGYHPFDLVVLREIGSEGLEPDQEHALRSWIHLGGYLVVSPASRSGDLYRGELLHSLLGDRLTEPRMLEAAPQALQFRRPRAGDRTAELESLGELPVAKRARLFLEDPLAGPTAKEIVGTQPDARGGDLETRLYAEIPYGSGQVGIFTPVGLWPQPDNSAFLQALWGGVLRCLYDAKGGRPRCWPSLSSPVSPDLHGLLSDESRDVGLPFITALIVGYLILSGPVLYFVLKRLNRLPAVIWVEPILVVAYLVVIFSVGYVTKGVLTKTRIWTFVSQRRGETLALRQSFFTIFSAEEATYRVESTGGFLLQPVFKNESSLKPVRLVRGGGGGETPGGARGLALEDFVLAHWEQGHFFSLDVEDLEGEGVEVAWPKGTDASGSQEPAILIANRLPHPIVDGVVADGRGGVLPVARIEPGAQERVAMSLVDRGPPGEWKDLLRRIEGLQRSGSAAGERLLFAGRVETEDVGFRVDRRSTLREKTVLFLLYDQR
jgi:hypothetical protein